MPWKNSGESGKTRTTHVCAATLLCPPPPLLLRACILLSQAPAVMWWRDLLTYFCLPSNSFVVLFSLPPSPPCGVTRDNSHWTWCSIILSVVFLLQYMCVFVSLSGTRIYLLCFLLHLFCPVVPPLPFFFAACACSFSCYFIHISPYLSLFTKVVFTLKNVFSKNRLFLDFFFLREPAIYGLHSAT